MPCKLSSYPLVSHLITNNKVKCILHYKCREIIDENIDKIKERKDIKRLIK